MQLPPVHDLYKKSTVSVKSLGPQRVAMSKPLQAVQMKKKDEAIYNINTREF